MCFCKSESQALVNKAFNTNDMVLTKEKWQTSRMWCLPLLLKTFSNPLLIRCMCKQLMFHVFNKQNLVYCELISPKIRADSPVLSTGRDVKAAWVPHAVDCLPSAFWSHSQLIPTAWRAQDEAATVRFHPYYRPKVFKQVPGMLQAFLTSPVWTLQTEGWLLSLECEAMDIALGSFWKAMDIWSE